LGRAALNAEVTKQASVVAYTNDFKLMRGSAGGAAAIFAAEARQGAAGEAAILE